MKFPGLNRRRSHTFLLLLGQLVLIAYVFQIGAFDHWYHGATHADMTPVERAVHTAHCHGDTGGCADSGAGIATLVPDTGVRLPLSAFIRATSNGEAFLSPPHAYIAKPSQPPRTA